MKRRFPILAKVILLGIGVSILTSGTAIIVSYFNQRNRGEETLIDNIDNTLNAIDGIFSDEDNRYTGLYINYLRKIKSYIKEVYESDTDHKTLEDFDFNFSNYLKWYVSKYPWAYQKDPRMGFISAEEADFKLAFFTMLNLLNNYQMSSGSISVFISYTDKDDKIVFLADSRMDTSVDQKTFFHVPGSFYQIKESDYFDGEADRKHNGYKLDGHLTRFTSIYDPSLIGGQGPIANLYIEYNLDGVYSNALQTLNTELLVLGLSSLVLILIYTGFSYIFFVRNINKLSKSSSEIKEKLINKNMNEVVDFSIKSNDEIKVLADSLTEMNKAIINYVDIIHREEADKQRTNAELSVASKIQLDSLPSFKFDDDKVSIRAFIKTAKEVGGDFYDYFYIDESHLVVLIADVSGKGIPASLFMMKGKELLKSTLSSDESLKDAVMRVNNILAKNNKELLFITSFIGCIDLNKNKITYINAGHEKPYIISKGKLIKLDGESNIVLGVEENYEFKEESHKFNEGDYLFMFTDGLNEAINDKEEEFGYPRVEATLKDSYEVSLDEVIANINKNLSHFTKDKEQFDDVTLLLLQSKGNELNLHYEKKDFDIITDIVDKFNERFTSIPDDSKAHIGIIIDELVNNLISYETRDDLIIDVRFSLIEDKIKIEIISNGNDYNPFVNHKDKYLTKDTVDPGIGGFGVKIVKDLVDIHEYKYVDNHSIITLIKSIKHNDK